MLGFAAAKRVVALGRSAFFPDDEPDFPIGRSTIVHGDDLAPQFGYVGRLYSTTRVLLLGINPGNGPDHNRSPGDARLMPAILRFAQFPNENNYVLATRAYMTECQKWSVWKRHCAEVIGAGKLSLDEIAYSNCLPWRTASKSAFSDEVARKAAVLYVGPLLEELAPLLIVALGKTRVGPILRMSNFALPRVIVWNRAQAATKSVLRERAEAAQEVLEMVKFVRK